jgi:translation initiation factor IF-2
VDCFLILDSPGQSPLFIPPAFKPPGTSGPGGDLVGPGSSIFYPTGYPEGGIDPATGGGIPFFGGDDPTDINPSFPDTRPLFGGLPGRGGMGPPSLGPYGNMRRPPFGGPGFGGGPFGGGPGFGGGFGPGGGLGGGGNFYA